MDTEFIKKIRALIANDQALDALKLLNDVYLGDDFIHIQSQLVLNDKLYNNGIINLDEWTKSKAETNYKILFWLKSLFQQQISDLIPGGADVKKIEFMDKIFISYNHSDVNIARLVKAFLEENGVSVIIDEDDMDAGVSIMAFIQQSVKNSDAVLSIMSSKSLQSGWVGQESVASMYAVWLADKKFIPVKLDSVAFDIDFQIAAQEALAGKIKDMKAKVKKLESLGGDARAFQDDINRMNELKNNLGQIIQKLKSVLMLDISGTNFDPSMRKVLDSIKKIQG